MRPDVLAEHLAATIRGLLGPFGLRLAALEQRDPRGELEGLAMRIAELEARAPVPGPAGPPGSAGRDGVDGKDGLDGKDGAPGLRYCGVHVHNKTYDTGDLVTAGGSAFHCQRTTTAAPGASPDWMLMVKRGRDGKDSGGRS